VNKMCLAANIPLVESGTAGYLGQVQPIVKVRPILVSDDQESRYNLTRTIPNALTAFPSLHLNNILFVRFALPRVSPYTA
jgi:hypothetical protein